MTYHLLPLALSDKQGRLTVRILSFLGNKSFTVIPKPKAPLLSFLSGGSMRMSRTEPQRDE